MWGWRKRSEPGRVELYTRGCQYAGLGGFAFSSVLLLLGSAASAHDRGYGVVLASAALACLAVGQGALSIALTKQGMDHYLGLRGAPGRRLTCGQATASVAGVTGVVALGAVRVMQPMLVAETLMFVLALFTAPYALLMPIRRAVWATAAVVVVTAAVVGLATGRTAGLAGTLVMGSLGCLSFAFSTRGSGWMLSVMRELEQAREVQARLAVAEERLRFGRDLHDVIGRNLSVIALKSELAVQLARRERPEAVEQMVEVQRIARESQGEVREVVRGYRTADLHTELVGALSVLRAAGVDCRVEGDDGSALPPEAQSVLAWVVREGTTNVLRHGDARRCAIRLRACPDGAAVLTMENDGLDDRPQGDGNGLAGLRERLTAVDGRLAVERAPGGTFRLTAEVPAPEGRADPKQSEGRAPGAQFAPRGAA